MLGKLNFLELNCMKIQKRLNKKFGVMRNDINAIIRQIRLEKGFSQDYVAKKLGISQKAYSNIENNVTQITLNRLKNIAEVMAIKVDILINQDLLSADGSRSSVNDSLHLNKAIDKYEDIISQQKRLIELLEYKLENTKEPPGSSSI